MIQSTRLSAILELCRGDLTIEAFADSLEPLSKKHPDILGLGTEPVGTLKRWESGCYLEGEIEFIYAIINRHIRNLNADVLMLRTDRDILASRMSTIREIADGLRNE